MFATRFGADRVAGAGDSAPLAGGATSPPVLQPASAREAAAMLAFAAAEDLGLTAAGGGTRNGLGNPPRKIDAVLSTARIDRILEYAPDDFVVSVEAGVKLARLQAALAPQRQWLPLDPPAAPASTIGGILSADASGPHRLLHGTARDLVIGIEVALPDGSLVRSGGRVVKNVAGYDLKKLFIGAAGTLGIITSVSLKLQAVAEDETVIAAGFSDYASGFEAARTLMLAGYELAALDLLNRPAFLAAGLQGLHEDSACALLAALVGTTEANEAQAAEVAVHCARGAALGTRAFRAGACSEMWARLRALETHLDRQRGASVRISVPLREMAPVAAQVDARLAETGPARLVARAGNGVLQLQIPDATLEETTAALRTLRADAVRLGGSLVVESASAPLRAALDAWGAPPALLPLYRRIKQAFDPGGTLAPGSFVGGL